jgi:hypothetical protein
MAGVGQEYFQAVAKLARSIIDAETVTPAGRLNALTIIAGVAIIFAGGVLDVGQAIVRLWDDDYVTGLPSVLALFAVWLGGAILCVGVLALFGYLSDREGST